METKAEETKEEFLQTQVVVSIELKHPMQYGKRKISFLDVTTTGIDGIRIEDGIVKIQTDVEGRSENFPIDNVVKWRIDTHFVPCFPKWKQELGAYEYSPYTYPERVSGYLGSYYKVDGECLGFLDDGLHVTTMKDLKA